MRIGRNGDRPEAQDRIRVAVVGVGYWGPNLVRNLTNATGFELASVCDRRVSALEGTAARYPHVHYTTSFEDILNDASIDAVAIATPVTTHYPLALAALGAGKHVFVEKPLATSSEQVLDLTRVAIESGLILMPGHTFLYSPPVTAIKRLIDDGKLGEIYFITASRVNLGLHQADASVVWDLGPHDFSILRYWLDALPTQVSAISRSCVLPGTPDVAFISMTYPSGTVAHVELSWLAPSKLRRTAIVGSDKMVVYDDMSNESIRIFDSGAELPDPENFGEYQLSYRTGEIVSPRVEAAEPLSLELADFGAAILEGKPLVSSPEIGLDVVRTIEAVDRSLSNGGAPVSVIEAPAPLAVSLHERIEEIKIDASGG